MKDELDILMKSPSWITKYGISTLFFLVLILITLVSFIPYSDLVSGSAEVGTGSTIIKIRTNDISKVKIGQEVFINIKNYANNSSLKLIGLVETIESVENKVNPMFLDVIIQLDSSDSKKILKDQYSEIVLGDGHILIGESSLFQRLIHSF